MTLDVACVSYWKLLLCSVSETEVINKVKKERHACKKI